MTDGRMDYIKSLAIDLKSKGITSIAVAYIENVSVSPIDGRFKYELINLTVEELSFLERYFHHI
jgi:hypothetical protein